MTTGWTLLGHWFLPIQKSIRGCAEIHVVCAGVCVCVYVLHRHACLDFFCLWVCFYSQVILSVRVQMIIKQDWTFVDQLREHGHSSEFTQRSQMKVYQLQCLHMNCVTQRSAYLLVTQFFVLETKNEWLNDDLNWNTSFFLMVKGRSEK